MNISGENPGDGGIYPSPPPPPTPCLREGVSCTIFHFRINEPYFIFGLTNPIALQHTHTHTHTRARTHAQTHTDTHTQEVGGEAKKNKERKLSGKGFVII